MIQVAPRHKKFGGKSYEFHYGYEYKADAERVATHLRSGGVYNARIIKIPNIRGHFAYVRLRPLTDRRSR